MNAELTPIVAEILNISSNESGKFPFKVIDSYKNLALAHYDVNTIGKTSNDNSARNIRGVIVDTFTKKIVCNSFGYTPTVVSDKVPEIGEIITDVNGQTFSFPESFTITPITEGTMIRVWKYDNEIMISSHRKINCEKSHWGTSGVFKNLFMKYVGNFDLEKLTENDNVAYFILMDKDLMISTKFNIGINNRRGVVVYIGSSKNIEIEVPFFVEINNEEKRDLTLFKIKEFNIEEANKHLTQGFYDYPAKEQSSPLCLGEGVIVSYKNGDEKKVFSISSPAYYRRSKMVDNDPNILHRCYKILNNTYYPKIVGDEDNYLKNYPSIPIMTDEEIYNLSDVIVDGPIPGKVYSDNELTDKTNKNSYELRLRNALTWYAMSLALPHQKIAFQNISHMIKERNQVCDMMCNNYDKFVDGIFEDYEVKHNPDVFKYIQHRLKNARDYAKLNSKSKNGKNPKASKDAITNNIRIGVMRDTGDWLYNIARVLIRIPKRQEESHKNENMNISSNENMNISSNENNIINQNINCNEEICMIPNSVRFNN